MKTLDEVIKAYEICMDDEGEAGNCIGCPYADDTGEPLCCGEDKEDALHYLREYRRVQNRIEKIALGNIEDTLDKIDNPPLTWDELKQMEGKPVWVEFLRDGESYDEEWIIIKDINDVCMADTQGYAYTIDDYNANKGWQAYRKERTK